MSIRRCVFVAALLGPGLLPAAEPDQATPPVADDSEADSGTARRLDTLSVIGRGAGRQVQRIEAAELQRHPPGSSALRVLADRPGVNFQSADPFGNYEWSVRLGIRGFVQTQLGFTLDRVPLGDMGYGAHSGLHISRALIAENLGAIEVAQGSAALDAAASGALGGSVRVLSADPEADAGVRLAQSFGSDSLSRSFLRLDSGQRGGFSGYLSVLNHEAEKWKGWGPQRQHQVNGKARWSLAELELSAYLATSRRAETDYADLSLDSQRRLGFGWDNYALDWQRAIDAAEGRYRDGVTTLDDAYYLGRGLRDDDLGYIAAEWLPGGVWSARITGYYHRNEGQGHWITPYTASPTVPLALRTTEYDIERSGLLPALTLDLERHSVEFGGWWERNVHGLQRNFYALDRNRPPNRAVYYRDPVARVFRQRFDIDTRQLYLRDRVQLFDERLQIEAGFKASDVDIDVRSLVGTRAAGSLRARDNFQPQLSLLFRRNDRDEWFASWSESMATFRAGVDGPYSATQASFDEFSDEIRPERARTLEAGFRRVVGGLEAALTGYRVRFSDRLLGIARCRGIEGCPLAFANVGSVTTRGAEASLRWRQDGPWELAGSLSWNDSRYDDDYLSGGEVVATAGKQVVDSPRWLASSRLGWSSGDWAFGLAAKYTDRRYITYLNDAEVPGYLVADLDASWNAQSLFQGREAMIRVQLSNLFDRGYFATVGSNNFATSDPDGQHYTLLAGAPRQLFVTLDLRF